MRGQTDSGTRGHGPSGRSAGRRVDPYRALWWVLVLVPAALWLALAVAYWSFRPQPIDSGNPLLDKYLTAVVGQTRLINPANTDPVAWDRASGLPDSEFAGWTDEFGGEPDYWLLRYYKTAGVPPAIVADYENSDRFARAYYLDEARRRGITSPALLMKLVSIDVHGWEQHASADVDYTYRQRRSDLLGYKQAVWRLVQQRHGGEYRDLMRDLKAAAPDEALPYYFDALVDAKQGEYEQALASIAAGNRAHNCSALSGFPYDQYGLDSPGKVRIADKCLARQFLHARAYPNAYMNDDDITAVVNALVQYAADQDNLAYLTEMKTFICRLARVQNNYIHNLRYANLHSISVAVKLHYRYWSRPQTGLSSDGAERIDAALDEFDKLMGDLKNRAAASPYQRMLNEPLSVALFLNELEEFFSRGTRQLVLSSESDFDFYQERQRYVEQSVLPVLDKVEGFDFTTLSWPEH